MRGHGGARVDLASLGTALVTGSGSGIGRAFAERLAADGHDLILVGRDRARLAAVAVELSSAHDVRAEVLAADLTDPGDLAGVERRLAADHDPVEILVNNAGDTVTGGPASEDPRRLAANFALNVLAVQALTRAVLPGMRRRRRGVVVNVSSVNGFVALPGAASVYGAGKAFVTVLSESIATTLAGTGVHVMALCPGLTATRFAQNNGIDSGEGPHGPAGLSTDTVVSDGLTDLARGRYLSIPGRRYKITAALGSLLPYRPLPAFLALVRSRGGRDPMAGAATAMVTEATSKVAAQVADRLAASGLDLILVGSDGPMLDALAAQISDDHGTGAQALVADLADPTSRAAVTRRLADRARPVDVLVNGAVDDDVEFLECSPAELRDRAQAGPGSVLSLTRAVLPGMLARSHGAVLNISGSTGFLPGHGSLRGATEAYVTSLSRGLALSLAGTGVHVTSLCPSLGGQTVEQPEQRAARIAARGLADLSSRRVVSVPDRAGRRRAAAARFCPRRLIQVIAARGATRRRPHLSRSSFHPTSVSR